MDDLQAEFEEDHKDHHAFPSKDEMFTWFTEKLDAAVKEAETKTIEKCVAELENKKLYLVRETASKKECSRCGFPDDYEQCMCTHNETIDLAIQALKKLLPKQA